MRRSVSEPWFPTMTDAFALRVLGVAGVACGLSLLLVVAAAPGAPSASAGANGANGTAPCTGPCTGSAGSAPPPERGATALPGPRVVFDGTPDVVADAAPDVEPDAAPQQPVDARSGKGLHLVALAKTSSRPTGGKHGPRVPRVRRGRLERTNQGGARKA